jgi:hypothetical protein
MLGDGETMGIVTGYPVKNPRLAKAEKHVTAEALDRRDFRPHSGSDRHDPAARTDSRHPHRKNGRHVAATDVAG